ncbi:MAG: DUF488 family protein [Polyangiales bacterium]
MPLQVYTARIACDDPDRFDITRKSGGEAGEPFAPSWKTLGPVLRLRQEQQKLEVDASDALRAKHAEEAKALTQRARAAAREVERAWVRYIDDYTAEMRLSYRARRAAWNALLARERVVLVCYCTEPERCHRTLLGKNILPKLGAVFLGETHEYLDKKKR